LKNKQIDTPLPIPFLNLPLFQDQKIRFVVPKSVQSFEFYAISDGLKRIYTNDDAISGYGKQEITDPKNISIINLFINGVLQPQISYKIEMGRLMIKTIDIPPKGAPIILQMIKF
jgi:hypothetical protein